MTGRRLRIGEAAERAAVSVRTLRYYEELGLLTPSDYSPGGARRYAEEDVARLARIRELKDLLGFNLDEVRTVLTAELRGRRNDVATTVIPALAMVEQMAVHRAPLPAFAPRSRVARSYEDLWAEVRDGAAAKS